MKYCQLFIFTVLIMGVSLTAFSQSVLEERLETYLNRLHHNQGFNGEILVARGNHIIFQKAIGKASFEHDVALKTGAKYRIASNTKSFTATLLAMAQTEGQLSLDDKASLYLDLLSPKFGAITIEQLIQHTSGLPHQDGIDDYWLTKSKLQFTTEQGIGEINKTVLLFEPGTQMRYSSLGYYLLACILEEVYQQPFKNILQDKILSKLQMNHTGIIDGLKIIPQMTTGYHWVTDARLVVAPYRNYSMLKGAGDMYATTTDLLKWNNSFLNQTLLSTWPQNINAHSTESTTTSGVAYSFGWYVDISGPIKYYHGWNLGIHNL